MGSHRRLPSGRAPGTRGLRVAGFAACLLVPGVARATGFLAYELGKTCLQCHASRSGRGGLTERGREAYAKGYRFARDPALTVACEGSPLSPGGVRLLTRRYRELGRKLFHLKEVGRNGKACVSCHVPGKGIEDAWLAYPKRRKDAGEWWTVEQAVNDCLVKRQGTRPLGHGSRSSVALQLYLRDMAEADHDSMALHPRLGRGSAGAGPGPGVGSPEDPGLEDGDAGILDDEGLEDPMGDGDLPGADTGTEPLDDGGAGDDLEGDLEGDLDADL